jgi:hypothetical protein
MKVPMPFSIPSAIPSIYESESLILPYHHRVEYLLDLTSERPFNLTQIKLSLNNRIFRSPISLFYTSHRQIGHGATF